MHSSPIALIVAISGLCHEGSTVRQRGTNGIVPRDKGSTETTLSCRDSDGVVQPVQYYVTKALPGQVCNAGTLSASYGLTWRWLSSQYKRLEAVYSPHHSERAILSAPIIFSTIGYCNYTE
jgi:hypothetical protein